MCVCESVKNLRYRKKKNLFLQTNHLRGSNIKKKKKERNVEEEELRSLNPRIQVWLKFKLSNVETFAHQNVSVEPALCACLWLLFSCFHAATTVPSACREFYKEQNLGPFHTLKNLQREIQQRETTTEVEKRQDIWEEHHGVHASGFLHTDWGWQLQI